MLTEIHQALGQLLWEEGRIPSDEVAIRFEVPTREWICSLTLPTIDLFLFDLKENTDLRQTALQTSVRNGRAEHRMAPRRMDLYYMVSALTTEIEDEHQLLWRALVTLMRFPQLPSAV